MRIRKITPRQALNKAYLKAKPGREEIELFKKELKTLFDHIDEQESEEFHKNLLKDFLNNTYYHDRYFINTAGRNDLVIRAGAKSDTPVGVQVEAKKPTNQAEMPAQDNLNAKAMQELLLYYLRERISEQNYELKHLVVTGVYEWYVFDAAEFERLFAKDKELVRKFQDFEAGRLTGTHTDFFYKQIAAPKLREEAEIECAYFDFREYEKYVRDDDAQNDARLVALYKLLSPEHLLKLPFANDSNSLDKKFYHELLHILGLEESKKGAKKLVGRRPEGKRNPAALLEDAIAQLDARGVVDRLPNPADYGETRAERLFAVGLELCITWMNRVLFLKLLEAQLLAYHKGDPEYAFLSPERVKSYDALDALFFQVLARKPENRPEHVREAWGKAPYLNSSLFEPTELEASGLYVSNLNDAARLPALSATVLKDAGGKKRTGELPALEYLLRFLDAYDFSSEGGEEIQEENKTLINASALGLIFEKINGYKDGSFFTPGFITMYMCRETLRRAVVQKFNEAKGWACQTLDDVYDKIEDRDEANRIVNGLKICDPAAGSGHFLVSALNELIAIKSELRILQDRDGRRLKEYRAEVANDELAVTDEDGLLFEYRPGAGLKSESARVQQALFHEKQTLIENCLFGVDINPNSVKICRLRLWIELLKNAYYKNETELETLPNIDINIKCGNSLVSRFDVTAAPGEALKNKKWRVADYRAAAARYRNAAGREEKREMERLIADIKQDFRDVMRRNQPLERKLARLQKDFYMKYEAEQLFDDQLDAKQRKDRDDLQTQIRKLENELDALRANRLYANAFEWRFEFPEVLDDDGNFVGFDVVIGNPPYINFRNMKNKNEKEYLSKNYIVSEYQSDLFILFVEIAFNILKSVGEFGYIIPNTIVNNLKNSILRKFILDNSTINSMVSTPAEVFPDATVDAIILTCSLPRKENSKLLAKEAGENSFRILREIEQLHFENNQLFYFDFLTPNDVRVIIQKIETNSVLLEDLSESSRGVQEYEVGKGTPLQTNEDVENKIYNSNIKLDDTYRKHIKGSGVNQYYLNWEGDYIKYGKNLASPRNPDFFKGERVVFREIISKSRLLVAYTDDDFTIKNTAHVIKPKKGINAKYLTGLLNSKLIGFYFINKFSERDDVFPKAKIGQCRLLPIKVVDLNTQAAITALVSEILAFKAADPAADTTALEAEIDRRVYELYGLTAAEIAVVEAGG